MKVTLMHLFDDFVHKQNQYGFNNFWRVNAPLELIWHEVIHYERWPAWCAGLKKVESLGSFGALEKGNHIRSIWKGSLPYTLTFDAVLEEFIPYSFLAFKVSGDLYGQGVCHFKSCPGNTAIHFEWNVSPTKLWMRMSSLVARSVFMENHNLIIEQAITGFTQRVSANSVCSGHGICP
jgi:hypothetical protein